jgi:transcriptional regulator with XRE-family HTH domain
MVTQVEIARTLGVDISTVNKILNRTPGYKFRKETIKRVYSMAKALGYNVHALKHRHQRMHLRAQTDMRSEFLIYGQDGNIKERGEAVIRDLSSGGALVSDIRIPSSTLPITPFIVGLRSPDGTQGREYRGHVRRFSAQPRMAVGIQFISRS